MSATNEPTELAPYRTYRERLGEGVLAYQRCDSCGAALFHPRVICTECGSGQLTWRESSGLGAVYSTSTIFERDADPYAVTLVDVDEGFRMMSTVVGVPAERVRIGMRVRARIERGDEATEPRPVFEPAPEPREEGGGT